MPQTMDRSNANIGKCVDHLQRDHLKSSQRCQEQWTGITPNLGVNRLFEGLLAVFHLGKASMQLKHITILPSSVRYLYLNEFPSAFTKGVFTL